MSRSLALAAAAPLLRPLLLLLLLSTSLGAHGVDALHDPARFVDPLIGTLNGGHVFAGAGLPGSSVKAVADTAGGDNQGGFVSDGSAVLGISQLHDDGTGGSPSLGQFKLLPNRCVFGVEPQHGGCQTREAKRALNQTRQARAEPGYFAVSLLGNIEAEVTTTAHTALHWFTFAEPSERSERFSAAAGHSAQQALISPQRLTSPVILFDLTNDLAHSFTGKGALDVSEETEAQGTRNLTTIKGWGEYLPSFGPQDTPYTVHFCATTPDIVDAVTFVNDTISRETSLRDPPIYSESGLVLKLDESSLQSNAHQTWLRIGVSWTSVEKACDFAKAEIPSITSRADFDDVRSAARSEWNAILSSTLRPNVTGVSHDQLKLFYSSLARTYISPTDVTGDWPLWKTSEPVRDSYYCLWDSFRVVHPLYALLNTPLQTDVVRSLMDIYRHEGFLPDCRMSKCKGKSQGGSNADSMLADSFVKGIRHENVDWAEVLKAMRKNAEVSPPDWGLEGRGGIAARKKLGYIPRDGAGNLPDGPTVLEGRSVSRTLEHSYNDFSIALVAAGLGQMDTYKDFAARSLDFRNLWNPNVSSDGFSGFLDSRYENGSWSIGKDTEDPRKCSPAFEFGKCYLLPYDIVPQFYEASSWEYSFLAANDMATIVDLMGGAETFLERLDHGWEHEYLDIGDEQGFLPNYLYSYAAGGYPRTVDRALKTYRKFFNTTAGGIPGNDDSGATAAYAVFTSLGIYPVAGTSVYLLSTPLFPAYSIVSGVSGKIATVRALNWDGAKKNKYIVSATLNGEPHTKNWIEHNAFFIEGGELVLTMGDTPSAFGTRLEDLPPSLSTGGFRENAGRGY